jgi:hypothetical protein
MPCASSESVALGLDLHKKQITGHLRVHRSSDEEPERIDIRFGTMPEQLLRLRDWIVENQVSDVVMESTGVYWMHLYELIESVTTPAVVNASHVKKVSGRKTDVNDAEWLSELHAHGLLRLSFVPPKEIRELRLLARYRTRLVADHTAARNRTIKMIEIAGVKLSSVVSDSFGKTGRALLDALSKGAVDRAKVEEVAKGTLRKKTAELEAALRAPLSDSQRQLLAMHLQLYDGVDAQLAEAEEKLMARAAPYAKAIEKLDAVPRHQRVGSHHGAVRDRAGYVRLPRRASSELARWSGSRQQHQCRQATPHCHAERESPPQTHLRSDRMGRFEEERQLSAQPFQPFELSDRQKQSRRGHGPAHLDHLYHLLSREESYNDLGAHFYDKRNKERSVKRHVQRLQQLGFTVALQPASD